MRKIIAVVFCFLLINVQYALSQIADADIKNKEAYPLVIGNVGFATDSAYIVAGAVPRGEITTFSFEIYNFGNKPIKFVNEKSNRFISVNFAPLVLIPFSSGILNVEFNAIAELKYGEFISEISIMSNDEKSPYKFMNLIVNVVESTSSTASKAMHDTIPSIAFNHYNYNYGHLIRGGKDVHSFALKNVGGMPLYIDSIAVPAGVKVLSYPKNQSIQSGEEKEIIIRINTSRRVGVQHNTVLVYTNDPNNPYVALGIHGSVRIMPNHKKVSNQCEGDTKY